MNRQQFKQLTDACDSILDAFSGDETIVAIPWLHVLNAHPNTIAQYDFAFLPRPAFATFRMYGKHLLYTGFKMMYSLFAIGRITGKNKTAKQGVLFISHLVQQKRSEPDFYYGTLPAFLQDKGIDVTIGLIDHLPGRKKKQQKAEIENGKVPAIAFPRNTSFLQELKMGRQCLHAYHQLMAFAAKESDPVRRNIFSEAAWHAITPGTMAALRIQYCIHQALLETQASTLLVTWEGRSWERLAVYTAKKMGLRCLAYQHTVLLESSHALLRSFAPAYDPEIIFTTGKRTADLISKEETVVEVVPYGSYRLAMQKEKNVFPSAQEHACLVAPEGIESECVLLFDFAIALAKENDKISFVFRTHPVLPFAELVGKYKGYANLPLNCTLSEHHDINRDFERCGTVLYRGSSVAMYAVLKGLKPFYYSLPGEMPIDPLFFIKEWHATVATPADYKKSMESFYKTPAETKQQQLNEALAACYDYVQVPDENFFYQHVLLKN